MLQVSFTMALSVTQMQRYLRWPAYEVRPVEELQDTFQSDESVNSEKHQQSCTRSCTSSSSVSGHFISDHGQLLNSYLNLYMVFHAQIGGALRVNPPCFPALHHFPASSATRSLSTGLQKHIIHSRINNTIVSRYKKRTRPSVAMNSQCVDIGQCLQVALKAAREAGGLIRASWDKTRMIEHKGAMDLVTETDKECEALIRGLLQQEFPEHSFIGEEETAALGRVPELTVSPTWLVDPVDGTTNFVHHFPFCCVSIALAVHTKVVLGVVYNPVLDELFYARDGGGAFLNDKKIVCSDAQDLQSAIFITELGTRRDDAFMDAVFDRMKALARQTRGMRSCGSCALNLCSVACGRADAYYEIGLGGPWDMAAGVKILQEAGGLVADPVGSEVNIMSRRVLGTNKFLLHQVSTILAKQPCAHDEPHPL